MNECPICHCKDLVAVRSEDHGNVTVVTYQCQDCQHLWDVQVPKT